MVSQFVATVQFGVILCQPGGVASNRKFLPFSILSGGDTG